MFQIHPLDEALFTPLYGLSDEALNQVGVVARLADSKPGFPCRLSLAHAEPGERVLLLNYEHQSAATPFRARHAIFVREGAQSLRLAPGELPPVFAAPTTFSVRTFDAAGMMVAAQLSDSAGLAAVFEAQLSRPDVSELHVHFAAWGCYAARVVRA